MSGRAIVIIASMGSMLLSCNRPCTKDKSKEFTIDVTLDEEELDDVYFTWEYEGIPPEDCEELCSYAFTKSLEEEGAADIYDGNIELDSCSATISCGDEEFEPDTGGAGCPDTGAEATASVQCSGVATREGFCDY